MTLDLEQLREALKTARSGFDSAWGYAMYLDYIDDAIGRVTAEIEAAKIDPIPQFDGEPRRPSKPDKIRVDRVDWNRASGLCKCFVCACTYYDHPSVRGYEWLTRLCDGRLVKL